MNKCDASDLGIMSVRVKLQRCTTEAGHLTVLITTDLVNEHCRLDPNKLKARVMELATSSDISWTIESQTVHMHPIQEP